MSAMGTFILHERLANDCVAVGDLPLCRVLLMDDCRFPWVILAPRRDGAVEIHDLPPADRAALIEEVALVSRSLKKVAAAEKMNIGALGNVVPQLHIHVVGRSAVDDAWPRPVWGTGERVPYAAGAAQACAAELKKALGI
jgi:diadenosine tetraphosphate (Ap4A) HIT family hydrolase